MLGAVLISIHALLAESDARLLACSLGVSISIHALLAESDPGKVRVVEPGLVFLSTLSLRRATYLTNYHFTVISISIHALLAESDVIGDVMGKALAEFLSTLSLRRATGTGLDLSWC